MPGSNAHAVPCSDYSHGSPRGNSHGVPSSISHSSPNAVLQDAPTGTPHETRSIPLGVKLYGFICLIYGGLGTVLLTVAFTYSFMQLVTNPQSLRLGNDPMTLVIINVVAFVLSLFGSAGLAVLGWSLLKNERRNAGRWAYTLIFVGIAEILSSIMSSGLSLTLLIPFAQVIILIVLSARIDPELVRERELKGRMERKLDEIQDRAAAEEGLLGRDLSGAGYIKLNFFNLFWVFVVCSVIGLVLEIIWHMAIVDPGVYQDRAGLLYGPFSPIYGFGALLMTCVLNRFYRSNPLFIFLVSAAIGGAFEMAVSLFMQLGFGAIAWDYSSATLFGLIPDPIAVLCHGRTSSFFAGMWGVLGLIWIRLLLPRLLNFINLIPWKWRYSVTSVGAVLMLINCLMTLGALDCWFQRVSGTEPTIALQQFYATYYNNDYMQHRFQSMTIHPRQSSRVQ
ncbi:putative ABC transporter permease [Collinsella sp. zg1085]|nr:putative ABC transporter permease [Collinsella sp. zg1085]